MTAADALGPLGPGRWTRMPYWFRDHVAAVRGEYAHARQEDRQGAPCGPRMPGPSRHPGGHAYGREKAAQRSTRNAQEGTR